MSITKKKKKKSDPSSMSTVLNNYFTSTAKKIKSNIKFSIKHFSDYLHSVNPNTSFIILTEKLKYLFQ